MRLFLPILTVAVMCGMAARVVGQQKDTVYFYHGQMLLGEVLSLSDGRLQLDSDDAGVVNIKYYKVRTFHAGIHFYRIRTTEERILYGRINTSENDGKILVNFADTYEEIDIDNIVRLQRYEEGFWKRLTGNISAGYDYTRSSNIGRINFDLGLNYLAREAEVSLKANTISTQENGTFSRDIENTYLGGLLYLDYSWILAGRIAYQRNLELSILRRFQEFIGAGYLLIQDFDKQLMAASGIALNQERSIEGEQSLNLFELPVILNFKLYLFQNPNLQFEINQNLYFGLTDKGRIRNDGNTRLNWEPFNDFIIGLNLYNNFDNKPPDGETVKNFDFGTVLSLGYKFD